MTAAPHGVHARPDPRAGDNVRAAAYRIRLHDADDLLTLATTGAWHPDAATLAALTRIRDEARTALGEIAGRRRSANSLRF